MSKNGFVILLALSLAACGQSSAIENAIRENLKDADSAKFKDLVISDSGDYACIVWNAKNSLGGYGEWSISRLRKVDSSWQIIDLNTDQSYCTEQAFARRQEADGANDKWK